MWDGLDELGEEVAINVSHAQTKHGDKKGRDGVK